MGLHCSAGNRAMSREAAGSIDSLLAPSHAAGNGTLSQFHVHNSSRDGGMQKGTDGKAWDESASRKHWSKLPFPNLLKACLDRQEVETQIKLQTCKAGRGFPDGRFLHGANTMVLCGQHGCCKICSNSCFFPSDRSGWGKKCAWPTDIAP